jgi:hypothetical protein
MDMERDNWIGYREVIVASWHEKKGGREDLIRSDPKKKKVEEGEGNVILSDLI